MIDTARMKRIGRRLMLLSLAVIVGFIIVFTGFIYFLQRALIYHPTPYGPRWKSFLGEGVKVLEFRTSQGKQAAIYLAPKENPEKAPEFLWIAFNGNASTALDWEEYLNDSRDKNLGFLLVDFPGYGACQGSASPKTILETSQSAFQALADELSVSTGQLEESMGVLGYSLGTCAGLQFAAKHPVKRVVLVAPLTSTLEMGKKMVPFPLYHLLTHRFDNVVRLKEVHSANPEVEVFIFHGGADTVIPTQMGRELADKFPHCVQYSEYDNVDHGFILDVARDDILNAINLDTDSTEGP